MRGWTHTLAFLLLSQRGHGLRGVLLLVPSPYIVRALLHVLFDMLQHSQPVPLMRAVVIA